jgi:tetratricopeptide (TPR) repeat protein
MPGPTTAAPSGAAAAPLDGVELTIAHAGELHALGRWREAARLYRQALAERPGDVDLLCDLSHCHSMLEELDAALRYADQAVAADPTLSAAHLRRYWPLLKQGKGKAARLAAEEAVRLEPESQDAIGALVDVLFAQRRLKDAEQLAQRMQRLAPHSAAPCRGLAHVALERKRYADAESWARRALAMGPGEAPSHHVLALALWKQRRHPEAIVAFRDALAADPTYDDARTNLARIGYEYLCLDPGHARPPQRWWQARWLLVRRSRGVAFLLAIFLASAGAPSSEPAGDRAGVVIMAGAVAAYAVWRNESRRRRLAALPGGLADSFVPEGSRFTRAEEYGALALATGVCVAIPYALIGALILAAGESLGGAASGVATFAGAVAAGVAGWWGLTRSSGARAWRPGRLAGLVTTQDLERARSAAALPLLVRIAAIGALGGLG